MPSLREIEKSLYTLFMDEDARRWLDSGGDPQNRPKQVASLDQSILKDLDPKGAAVYSRSIAWEHKNLMARIYPYTAKLLGDLFAEIVRDYYERYPSSHFDFHQIVKDFPEFLANCRPELVRRYPYIVELADFEWLELEKLEDKAVIQAGLELEISKLEQIQAYGPVLNQTLTLRKYKYAIPDIAENFRDKKRPRKKFPEKSCRVTVFRAPQSDDLRFIELGEVLSSLVEETQKGHCSYQVLLKLAIDRIPEKDPTQVVLNFLELIDELQKDKIFVGSVKL